MKERILIISAMAYLSISFLLGQDQKHTIAAKDKLNITNDSIIIRTGDYRGDLIWEVSKDLTDWNDVGAYSNNNLQIGMDTSAYFRAKIIEGSCQPIFSDIVLVQDSFAFQIQLINGCIDEKDAGEFDEFVVRTPIETMLIDSLGNFNVPVSDSSRYKMIFVEKTGEMDKDTPSENKIVFIGLYDSERGFIANDSTTTLSLLLMNPLLLYLDKYQSQEYILNVTQNDTFRIIADSIHQIRINGEYFLDKDLHSPLYNLIGDLMASGIRSCSKLSAKKSGETSYPYPHAYNASKNKINIINPCNCYYSVGIYTNFTEFSDAWLLDKVDNNYDFEFSIPPIVKSEPKDNYYTIQNGGYRLEFKKGGEWSKLSNPYDPHARATMANTFELLDIIHNMLGLNALPSGIKSDEGQLISFFKNLIFNEQELEVLNDGYSSGDPGKFFESFCDLFSLMSEDISYSLFQTTGKDIYLEHQYIKAGSKLASTAGFVMQLVSFVNAEGAFLWDLVFGVDTWQCITKDDDLFFELGGIPILDLFVLDVASKSISVKGQIIHDGCQRVSESGFYWSETNNNPDVNDNSVIFSQTEDEEIEFVIPDLKVNTDYYIKFYATNAYGTAYSEVRKSRTDTGDPSDQEGTFFDSRDGQEYKRVKIGDQIWMAENLKFLPELSPVDLPMPDRPIHDPSYYVYDYRGTIISEAMKTYNYNAYGVLYSWTAAQEVCPEGWRLPSVEDWDYLLTSVGGSPYGPRKLIESGTAHWLSADHLATNESGFTALPGGMYEWTNIVFGGVFNRIGINAYFWSSTPSEDSDDLAMRVGLTNDPARMIIGIDNDKNYGFSVRCIKD